MKIVTRGREIRAVNSDAFYGSPRKRVRGLLSVVCRLSPPEMEIVREISPLFLSSLPGRRLARGRERGSDAVLIVTERNEPVIKESPGFKNVRKECTGEMNALVLRYLISG